jgi:hypothetical protein
MVQKARIADAELEVRPQSSGAVLIEGPRYAERLRSLVSRFERAH